jgi:hypothetical protein
MIIQIDNQSRHIFAVAANYLVVDEDKIIGAFITKREAIAQEKVYKNAKNDCIDLVSYDA